GDYLADSPQPAPAEAKPKRQPKAASAPAPVPDNTAVINWVEIRLDKKQKPYIFAEGGFTCFTREPFRAGGIPCETWEEPGRYTLLKPVAIDFDTKDNFRNITKAPWFEEGAAS